ncbi:hypothetical protein ACHAPV_001870 [Trichoderma viride]
MPLYDVEYVTPLTSEQQEQLAIAFTDLHSKRFNTPRFFINVRYTDVSNQVVFRGGVRRKYNRVIIRTRAGSNRTNETYLDHCKHITAEWERLVGKEGEKGLRTTGEEDQWVQDNIPHFKALAAAGDEDFIEIMRELEGK